MKRIAARLERFRSRGYVIQGQQSHLVRMVLVVVAGLALGSWLAGFGVVAADECGGGPCTPSCFVFDGNPLGAHQSRSCNETFLSDCNCNGDNPWAGTVAPTTAKNVVAKQVPPW